MSESILEELHSMGIRLTDDDIIKIMTSDEFMKVMQEMTKYELYHRMAREICGNIRSPE